MTIFHNMNSVMFILNYFIHYNNVDEMIEASKSLEMYALCT